jgi:hypothetical protein
MQEADEFVEKRFHLDENNKEETGSVVEKTPVPILFGTFFAHAAPAEFGTAFAHSAV